MLVLADMQCVCASYIEMQQLQVGAHRYMHTNVQRMEAAAQQVLLP